MKIQKFVIFVNKNLKIKNIVKLGTIFIIVVIQENIEVMHVAYAISSILYHCIIKELVEEFEIEFTCLGANTEKYINFSVPLFSYKN